MKRHPLPAPILAVCFIIMGVLLVLTALFPQRNSVMKGVYWLWTILPRAGSMTDKTWVMINGIGLLVVGFVLLGLWVFWAI
jgi:hypothetical protein